ncbi:hypothetical protein F4821DRAFT_251426 [Hypoxylon rubiginosum]|uniref:Uncharacterized protein n=1 Tax=Hypoxylon rubiginosum TaxID=110542 RepID=A0ACC0CJC4_9PEZI|nr:hypothetical protein F4821DRAFT_251426 [Hypoxylon rubiginosum]
MSDGRLQEGSPDTLTYTLKVVGEVQKGTVGEIWVGKDATMNRWALRLLPSSMFMSCTLTFVPTLFLLTNGNRIWSWMDSSRFLVSWPKLPNQ